MVVGESLERREYYKNLPRILALATIVFGATTLPLSLLADESALKVGSRAQALNPFHEHGGLGAFAIGDRLKITLFERYAAGDRGSTLSSLVELSEVTGEYMVGQDGAVFVPLLGEVQVVGLTQVQLRAEMIEKFTTTHGGDVEVSVRLTEREPVYVTGAVVEPGSFKHIPGMTVLHALALAQGSLSGKADAWRRFDISRERERMRKAEERLARLRARYAVLNAEMFGHPALAPVALIALVGQDRAGELIAEAARLRDLERTKLNSELASYELVLAALDRELTLLREGLQQSEKSLVVRMQRLETTTNLRARGVTTDANFVVAQNDLTAAQDRWNDTRTAIARVERSIAQARQEKMRLSVDEPLERERELARVKAEIVEEQVTMEVVAKMLVGIPKDAVGANTELSVLIVRRQASGVLELPGNELSLLLPGDLVKVMPRPLVTGSARAEL